MLGSALPRSSATEEHRSNRITSEEAAEEKAEEEAEQQEKIDAVKEKKAEQEVQDQINAKVNDVKGDSLCKKGLARYLKVAPNESLAVAGLYSAAPVKTVGERLCYSFGVPVSGCKVHKAEAKPKQAVEPKKAAVAEAAPKPPVEPKKPTVAEATPKPQAEPKKPAVIDSETPKESTNVLVKTSSFLCVVKYKEVNGERKTISRREYRGHNFKSPKDFDRFCQEEFARIRAQGEANLRAVRNFGK